MCVCCVVELRISFALKHTEVRAALQASGMMENA